MSSTYPTYIREDLCHWQNLSCVLPSPLGEVCFALSLQFQKLLELCGSTASHISPSLLYLSSKIVSLAYGIVAPSSWLPSNWNCTKARVKLLSDTDAELYAG